MTRGRFYMHKNCLDAYLEVIKSFRINSHRYDLKVAWHNLGYTGQPWSLGVTHRMKISNASEWVDVTHKLNQVRTQSGVPV